MSRELMQQALEALEDVPYMSNKDDYERLERVTTALRQALEKPKYRRGDRLLCLETEEYCVIHISGTDRQYVKFPDGHVGQYTNQQVADHFELLPKEVDADDTRPQARSLTDELMDCVDRLGSESDTVDPRVWQHLLVYAPLKREWIGLTKEDMPDGDNPMFDTNEFYAGMSAWHGWVLREVLFDNGELIGHREPEQKPVAWANSFDLQNFDMKVRTCPDLHHTVPLYTAPPKKQWVGLTKEDMPDGDNPMFDTDEFYAGMAWAEAKLKERNHD